ncbi:hypothetical protein ACO2Q8_23670 [Larkinella sp. VNQ87]|uniref:hypothetical protein n=1 Tax=Larkinella sp. VNQ87 TaxID=3400921 RepID=UPI003C05B39F
MEVLNYFVRQGLELQSAFLTDAEGRRTELPVAGFDGGVVSETMRRLEAEYQTLFQLVSIPKK